ncbi:MAG: alpha/beta hydrolase [Kiritimatiellaeota bacterium]|nr:alpha/beta hydrolase [Kiritimatiellota bacterium]
MTDSRRVIQSKRPFQPYPAVLRRSVPVILFLKLWVSNAPAAVTQPGPPASGPGSPQYRHAAVRQLEFGSGDEQCWVFVPENPTPESAPLIVFLHGWGGMQPRFYGAWIHHLVRRGAVVVFPRYQATFRTSPAGMTDHAAAAVRGALQKLDRMGPPRLDLQRTAFVGHSLGAVIACNLANGARQKQLPVPRCLLVVQPGDSRPEHPLVPRLAERIPSIVEKDYSGIAPDTLVLLLAGEDDRIVGADTARRLFRAMTSVPLADRNLLLVRSDRHGDPPLTADHLAPVCNADPVTGKPGDRRPRRALLGRRGGPEHGRIDALDWWAYWRLFDALTDAAWQGAPRDRALGGGPEQTYMGKWSDGRPVTPLKLLDASSPTTQPSRNAPSFRKRRLPTRR